MRMGCVMRRMVVAVALIGLLVSPLTVQAQGPMVHVVQAGENLFRIGLRYGVTAQQIAAANRLASVTQVYAGQRLVIPADGAASAPVYSSAATAQAYHAVSAGDTLYSLAWRYGVSVQALAAANNLTT